MSFLLDTNILIYYISRAYNDTQRAFVKHLFKTSHNISIITKLEFLGWHNFTDNTVLFHKGVKSFTRFGISNHRKKSTKIHKKIINKAFI